MRWDSRAEARAAAIRPIRIVDLHPLAGALWCAVARGAHRGAKHLRHNNRKLQITFFSEAREIT